MAIPIPHTHVMKWSVGVVSLFLGLKLEKSLVIATVRCSIQLSLMVCLGLAELRSTMDGLNLSFYLGLYIGRCVPSEQSFRCHGNDDRARSPWCLWNGVQQIQTVLSRYGKVTRGKGGGWLGWNNWFMWIVCLYHIVCISTSVNGIFDTLYRHHRNKMGDERNPLLGTADVYSDHRHVIGQPIERDRGGTQQLLDQCGRQQRTTGHLSCIWSQPMGSRAIYCGWCNPGSHAPNYQSNVSHRFNCDPR